MNDSSQTLQRFTRKDILFVLICLAILAACAWFSASWFQRAFPEASIDFTCNRTQAGDLATSFLESMDPTPPNDYKQVSRFGLDGAAKTFLEKELGLEQAQPLFGEPVRLWSWQYRWFKPATKEEYKVFITPAGDVIRLDHQVDEERAGAHLAKEEAHALADSFLFTTLGLPDGEITFKQSSRIGRPNRTDWQFIYAKANFEPVAGSEYRYQVTIQGDRVDGYREWLHVPQQWYASYERLRSMNNLGGMIASVLTAATLIALAVVIILKLKRKNIRWKTALVFGIILSVLVLANSLNDLPNSLYWYDTTTSWPGFLIETLLLVLLQALGAGTFIFVVTLGAETMYRERYPHLPALPRMFTPRGLRTKSAFKNILLGITLTPFFLAYQIVFYMVANKLGGWSPADVPYDNLLNTAMPWLAVLLIGFLPATSEEFISRMFSIPFLEKVMKGRARWLAVLIPAFIWGFGHAGYAAQPWYIRGLEVGIGGVIIGIVMLRFGILAPLVWHFTVDALYTALLLFRSDNTYYIITAGVATGLLVIPLLAALVAYFRKGGFLPEAGTLNKDENAEQPEPLSALVSDEELEAEPQVVSIRVSHLPASRRLLAVGLLIAGVVAVYIPVERIGSFHQFDLSRKEAISVVKGELRSRGWADPDTLKYVTLSPDDIRNTDQLVYLLKETNDISRFNTIADTLLGETAYAVVGYKPEERLRFLSRVHARTGSPITLHPMLPEEMAGDSLPSDSARALVEAYLRTLGEDPDGLELKTHEEEVRPERFDQFLTYEAHEADPRTVSEARFRRSAEIRGDWLNASAYGYYKIPESWIRERDATTALRAVVRGLRIFAIAGLIGWAVGVLVWLTRRGVAPWKKAFVWAIPFTGILLLNGVNTHYQYFQQYWRMIATPWTVAQAMAFMVILIQLAGYYLFISAGFALLGGLYRDKLPLLQKQGRRLLSMDAWAAVAAAVGALLLYRAFAGWLAVLQPKWVPFDPWHFPATLFLPEPFIFIISQAMLFGLLAAFVLGFLAWCWRMAYTKIWQRGLLLVIALLVVLGSTAKTPGEWLWAGLTAGLLVLLGWALVRFFVDGRPASLIAAVFMAGALRVAGPAMGMGNTSLMIQAIAALVFVLVLILGWLGLSPHEAQD